MKPLLLALVLATPAFAADPVVPDPVLTPGAWHVPATPLAVLCATGYSATVRDVSAATKRQVFARYGLRPARPGAYEIDHAVSLSLNGTNDLANLWPQSYAGTPLNARRKDQLEVRLYRQVCAGNVALADAQRAIASDWPAAYQRWVLGVVP